MADPVGWTSVMYGNGTGAIKWGVEFVSGLNISMYIFIIILNIIGATILAVISFRKISKLDNESVVRSVGQWI